jgi:hypothetical protein
MSVRIEGLIERYHEGDRGRAAIRLGITPQLLDGLLSGDWRQFSLDALIAVIHTHGVTIDWLLGSNRGWESATPSRATWIASNIEPEGLS